MFTKQIIKQAFLAVIFHVVFSGYTGVAQSSEVDQARAIITKLIQDTGAPGLSVTIVVDNEIKISEGFGVADLENSVPVTPDTLMRVGSLSKSISATAVAKANEQGLIDIDADIRAYLPTFPDKKHAITLRQLGGHLGGVRHYNTDKEKYVFQHFDSVQASLSVFQNDPLVSAPGAQYLYSSYGYNLLSAVAAAATETDFPNFLDKYLRHSLHMKHTVQDDVNLIIPGRARQYERNKNGKLINAPYTDNSYKFAGGGMLSSSSDLAKFGNGLVDNNLLTKDSKELLFSSQVTTDGAPTGYGFGWFVDMDKFLDDRKDRIPPALYVHLKKLYQERKLIWHSGTSSGAVAMLMLVPETRVVIAVTANLGGIGPQVIAATMELEAVFSAAYRP